MPQNKNPIQERIEQERANNPTNELTTQEIAQKVGELARKEGVQRPEVRLQISNSIKNSESYKLGIKNRNQSFRQDPEYQKSHQKRMQALHKDPNFIEKQRQAREKLYNDPERLKQYKENNRQGYLKVKETPEYWTAYYKGIKIRDSNPEYHKKRIDASNAVIAIKISTPDGEFNSISDAARHFGLTSEGMRYRVNSSKYPEFKKIEK